jgi:uncharacterized tellurite resistance protein B-like protein
MPQGFLTRLKGLFQSDNPVTQVVRDPGKSAEILLLMRLVLADGVAREEEMATLKLICAERFNLVGKDFDEVIAYLGEFGYETTGAQATAIFRELPEERKRGLIGHLIAVAKADKVIDAHEVRLIARAGEILGIDPRELIRGHSAV